MKDPDCRFLWIDAGGFSGIAYVVYTEDLVFLLYLIVVPAAATPASASTPCGPSSAPTRVGNFSST